MISLGTSFGTYKVATDADGFPTHKLVLAAIRDGVPIQVVGDSLTHTLHLTPAAILTVTKEDD